jgi:hypothetical protein
VFTGSKRINGDDLKNIRYEASRHFRNKYREYLRDKINEFVTNRKNKNIRNLHGGINEFKRSINLKVFVLLCVNLIFLQAFPVVFFNFHIFPYDQSL